jgi:hypothetical protein
LLKPLECHSKEASLSQAGLSLWMDNFMTDCGCWRRSDLLTSGRGLRTTRAGDNITSLTEEQTALAQRRVGVESLIANGTWRKRFERRRAPCRGVFSVELPRAYVLRLERLPSRVCASLPIDDDGAHMISRWLGNSRRWPEKIPRVSSMTVLLCHEDRYAGNNDRLPQKAKQIDRSFERVQHR